MVQENKMTVIFYCLRVWRHYLLGSHFTIMTDNIATSYFNAKEAKFEASKVARFLSGIQLSA